MNHGSNHQLKANRMSVAGLFRLVTAVALAACAVTVNAQSSFRIAGYLPDYRAAAFDTKAARGLTDLFVFSAEPTATGQLEEARLDRFPWTKLQELRTGAGVRLILCVGGWGRSAHFPAVAGSPRLRQEQ